MPEANDIDGLGRDALRLSRTLAARGEVPGVIRRVGQKCRPGLGGNGSELLQLGRIWLRKAHRSQIDGLLRSLVELHLSWGESISCENARSAAVIG